MAYIKLLRSWHQIQLIVLVSGARANILLCMHAASTGTKVAQLFLSAYHLLNSTAGRFYPHYLVSSTFNKSKYSVVIVMYSPCSYPSQSCVKNTQQLITGMFPHSIAVPGIGSYTGAMYKCSYTYKCCIGL